MISMTISQLNNFIQEFFLKNQCCSVLNWSNYRKWSDYNLWLIQNGDRYVSVRVVWIGRDAIWVVLSRLVGYRDDSVYNGELTPVCTSANLIIHIVVNRSWEFIHWLIHVTFIIRYQHFFGPSTKSSLFDKKLEKQSLHLLIYIFIKSQADTLVTRVTRARIG